MSGRREVTLCNHNFSEEGIYHPDRIMEDYDFLFMQKGEWTIVEDGETFHIGPGQILVLEPGRHHLSIDKCSPKMRNVYIHMRASGGDVPSGFDAAGDGPRIYIGKLTDTTHHPELLHIFERIIETYFSYEATERDMRCSIYLEELLLRLSDINAMQTKQTDVLVQEIIHRFHSNADRFYSTAELAESYYVSVRTISGRFKRATGESIHQYQINLKLDMAYDELPFSPNRPIRDVAKSYGFYDEYQFSKLFKRRFGIAPSQRR